MDRKFKVGEFAVFESAAPGRNNISGRMMDSLVPVRVVGYSESMSTSDRNVVQIESKDFQYRAQDIFCYEDKLRPFNGCKSDEVSEFKALRNDILEALNSEKSIDEILMDIHDLVTN